MWIILRDVLHLKIPLKCHEDKQQWTTNTNLTYIYTKHDMLKWKQNTRRIII
jgi:hypothetical protein